MQGWQHGRGLFKAKISAKKLPFRIPELHCTRKYYSTPNFFFRRSKGARRRRLSSREGGVGDSHIKVTGMFVAKLKWNPSGRTVGVAQADPYKTKNIRKKTPRHAFCTVLTPLSDTRKSLKNGNFLFQTPQVRPKSAIYTPREGSRDHELPRHFHGESPPPPGAFEATLVQTQTICEKIGTRLIQVSFHAVLGSLFLVWGAWQYAWETLKTLAYVFCKRLLQVREYLTPNK